MGLTARPPGWHSGGQQQKEQSDIQNAVFHGIQRI